jgi:hypothetical protein
VLITPHLLDVIHAAQGASPCHAKPAN